MATGVPGGADSKAMTRRRDSSGSSDDRLWAARLLGVTATVGMAQSAVHMPGGYLGEFGRTTAVGFVLAVAVAVVCLAAAIASYRGRHGWRPAVGPTLLAVIALFVPALAADPVVAGAVVLWSLALLGKLLFPTLAGERGRPAPQLAAERPSEQWLARNGRALRHLLVLALGLTVIAVGFGVRWGVAAFAACVLLDMAILAATSRLLALRWREGSRDALLVAVPLLAAAFAVPSRTATLGWLGAFDICILAVVLRRSEIVEDLLGYFFRRPAQLIAASFATIIASGTLLLSFPAASATGVAVAPIDALFTATSATCVTGLIVVDTPSAFSTFGHAVILALIQAGGLNIMVLSAFTALLLGSSLGLRGQRALAEVLELPGARTAGHLATFIVASTVAIEAVGAVALAVAFWRHGFAVPEAVWRGVFHAVSAFCNAGFALQTDSLTIFKQDSIVLTAFAALIVLGGLGFAVLASLWTAVTGRRQRFLSVHVRIVAWATAVLVVAGWILFAAAEWRHSLAGLSTTDKVANALFQSVTPRTAGFNSVDLALFHPVTVLLMLVLMFVGASPGGTGGGIKTTTAAVLLGAVPAMLRGGDRVELFRHTVPLTAVYRSAAIATVAALMVTVGTAALVVTDRLPLVPAVFEVTSALGTVGLSLNVTPALSVPGKIVISLVMFIGRIGPLTAALLLGRAAAVRLERPDARIMVG